MPNPSTLNLSRVLRIVWINPGISRIEIAKKLNLDKSTITNIIARLMKQAYIVTMSEGEASPQGGRKPVGLAINTAFGVVLGMEITTDKVMVSGMNLQGHSLFMRSFLLQRENERLEQVFERALKDVRQDIEDTHMPLIGIGLGLSGIINPITGEIIQSIPLDIHQRYPLLERIRHLVDVPIFIDNDANCCCWEEMVCSGRDRYDNFLFVLAEDRFHSVSLESRRIGFAVGLGLVIHGEVLRGLDFSAGEFQSVLWKSGNTSQFSFTDDVMAEIEKYPDAINDTIQELAVNVAFLTNVMDVSRVVLGGGLEKYGDLPLQIFAQEIEKNWSYPQQGSCEICMVQNGEYAVAIGAAAMFLEKLFTVPRTSSDQENLKPDELTGFEILDSCKIER
ncbi:MAG: ROK family transcriptional regulator [Sphaerochaeta sp.]|nr:ROK family transcriptional regulator [Sphaerochaeta sp.]